MTTRCGAYHRYLAAHLTFPFEAKWEPEYGPRPIIKITGLGDPEEDFVLDEMHGLLCEARAKGRLVEVLVLELQVTNETEWLPDVPATRLVGKATTPQGPPSVRRRAAATPVQDDAGDRPVACTVGVRRPEKRVGRPPIRPLVTRIGTAEVFRP